MLRFREVPGKSSSSSEALSADAVRRIIGALLSPAHFIVGPNLEVDWEFGASIEWAWETFQGRLLDPAHTRCRRAFEAWQVFFRTDGQRSPEPVLAVLFDVADQQVHVVRALEAYVWEGYDAGDNVFLSREVRKWVRELVGTLPLAQFSSPEEFRDELMGRVFQAVVGTSRLPLTSVEAPLPAFSLGELAYCYRPDISDVSDVSVHGALTRPRSTKDFSSLMEGNWKAGLSRMETVKLVEIFLRATPAEDLPEAAALFRKHWPARSITSLTMPGLFRELFNAVALSPYTDFVDKTLAFLRLLVDQGGWTVEEHVDFLGYLLRQIPRHLTAYDLATFHHQGANYPDILLLDAVLKEYRERLEQRPELWLPVGGDAAVQTAGRRRRRALRMGWLLRRHYEGHPVPDAPTSPGENARVLPAPHVRVPEEQIRDPATRTRRLFQNDPLATDLPAPVQAILRASLKDLHDATELQELGLAVFLDRPLGVFHRPGEPDQTLLLSYEAFSRTLAQRRLQELTDWGLITTADRQAFEERLRNLPVDGVRPPLGIGRPRPGTVSLADAYKVADDFVILRTTASSLRDFFGLFDFTILAQQFHLDFLKQGRRGLVMRLDPRSEGGLVIFDHELRRRLELQVEGRSGYAARGGVEFPVGGLRLVRIWDTAEEGEALREHALDLTIPVSGFPAG